MKEYPHPHEAKLTQRAKELWQLYLHLADDEGLVRHPREYLAAELGVAPVTISRNNMELRAHRYIERLCFRDDANRITGHAVRVYEEPKEREPGRPCRYQDCTKWTRKSNALCDEHHQLERIDRRWKRRVLRWYREETPRPSFYAMQQRVRRQMGIYVPEYTRVVADGKQPSTGIIDALIEGLGREHPDAAHLETLRNNRQANDDLGEWRE